MGFTETGPLIAPRIIGPGPRPRMTPSRSSASKPADLRGAFVLGHAVRIEFVGFPSRDATAMSWLRTGHAPALNEERPRILPDDLAEKIVLAMGVVDAGMAADGEGVLRVGGRSGAFAE